MAFQMMQNEAEIDALAALVKDQRCRSLLEIGAKFGGSLMKLAEPMPSGSRIVAVDLPRGTKMWKESEISLKRCAGALKDRGHDVHLLWGKSQDNEIVARVRALGPYDIIFIDADHTMAGVTADWINYGPLGKLVAFHDISWSRAPDWAGGLRIRIDVPQFWDQIKQAHHHVEYRFCPSGINNGIGVLWR